MSLIVNRRDAFRTAPETVLFDFDNTLYPYRPAHEAGMTAVRRKAERQLSVSPENFEKMFDEARRQVKDRVGDTAASHSRLLYFHRMIELLGLKTQAVMALDFEQTYWQTYLSEARLFDGVTAFLDELRIAGIKSALVTDLTAQIQFRKLVYLRLEHAFDFIVTSEEAGFDKPHAAPFELALEKLGVGKDNVWMIGDSINSDIKGARDVLQAATLMRRDASNAGADQKTADVVFDTFDELTRFLKDMGAGTTDIAHR
jgi:FMN phosphatase YigB (HAD superfamily)